MIKVVHGQSKSVVLMGFLRHLLTSSGVRCVRVPVTLLSTLYHSRADCVREVMRSLGISCWRFPCFKVPVVSTSQRPSLHHRLQCTDILNVILSICVLSAPSICVVRHSFVGALYLNFCHFPKAIVPSLLWTNISSFIHSFQRNKSVT